ncbi:MAG: tetratricopeptide repeat protein, partial [Planctomycetes bacterium]|nr:tetratricopeptide repeat protein [Planctomycetota bacterium]
MKLISPLLALCLSGLLFTSSIAQDAADDPEPEAKITVQEYADRAQRLREFGYPLLAQEQLDKGLSLEPTHKAILVEYLRLFNAATGDPTDAYKYIDTLLRLYPDDYSVCLEIARLLFMMEPMPTPPDTSNPEKLKTGLTRLDKEMKVYLDLANFIISPEGDLPESAKGRPRLSLAFLARAEKASPGTYDIAYLSARELDVRGRSFQRWAEISPALSAFGDAAQKLYALTLPLFQRASGSSEYAAETKVQAANLLYRMGKLEESKKAIIGAELLAPNSLRLADTKVAIANQTNDIDLLIEALEKRHDIFNEIYSELDLSVAYRIKGSDWPFQRWREYQGVMDAFGRKKTLIAKAVLQVEPKFLEIHYLMAEAAMTDARNADIEQDGIKLLRAALLSLLACQELADSLADWHRMNALIFWQLGDFAKAAKAYEATAKADPSDRDASEYAKASADIAAGKYTALDYHIYLNQLPEGDFKKKSEILSKVVKKSPKFLAAQQVLGKICMFYGNFETAYLAYMAANKLEAGVLMVIDGLAHAAMEVNRFEESLKYFKELEKLRSSDDNLRWISLLNDLIEGNENRRLAFVSWRESTRGTISESGKKTNLEKAYRIDPTFSEAMIDLAVVVRKTSYDRARMLLDSALKNARDKYVRASVRRELGKLYADSRAWAKSIIEFEAAYDSHKGDGVDMLFAATAHLKLNDPASASACMRKLFVDIPNTPLLRPLPSDLMELNLNPKAGTKAKNIHPAYGVGDKAEFTVVLDVMHEGGGLQGETQPLEIDLNLTFKETPASGGIWVIDVDFSNAPIEKFPMLKELEFTLKISPWFGLAEAPDIIDELQSVVDPIVQVITEGFTAGLGDLPLRSPQVWKNEMTLGPPHFGGQTAKEAAALVKSSGDSFVLLRKAGAGKR